MKEIREITKGCEIRSGDGNPDGNLVLVYPGPEFKSLKTMRQLVAELDIDDSDIYVTPFHKDPHLSQEELFDILVTELAIVAPTTMWSIGEVIDLLGIQFKMEHSYGLYLPFYVQDFYTLVVPSRKMIASMPESVTETFWTRMQRFGQEYNSKKFKVVPSRRADVKLFRAFAEDQNLIYDEKLEKVNSFWPFYSFEFHRYVIVTNTQEVKKTFKKLPFGIAMTESEMKKISDIEDAKKVFELLDAFGGEVEKIS